MSCVSQHVLFWTWRSARECEVWIKISVSGMRYVVSTISLSKSEWYLHLSSQSSSSWRSISKISKSKFEYYIRLNPSHNKINDNVPVFFLRNVHSQSKSWGILITTSCFLFIIHRILNRSSFYQNRFLQIFDFPFKKHFEILEIQILIWFIKLSNGFIIKWSLLKMNYLFF